MRELAIADRVEILIIVDNVTDNLSTAPAFVENEFRRFWGRGGRVLSGQCLCCAAHGLSCAITAWRGDVARTLLFDTGPDAAVFERNVERLGFDMGTVDAIVLSHGHWDHGGAMLRALEMVQVKNGSRVVPTYMHPGMYRTRATRTPDGTMHLFDDVPSTVALEAHGAHVIHATDEQLILDDLFFISGEIPRVTKFETGLLNHYRRTADGADWEPDPLIVDERFVAVGVKDRGLFVLTACSHAGVVNVLTHARECFPGRALHGVMGGFHLSGSTERIIPDTVDALRAFDLKAIAPAHCTGWRATSAIASAFGDAVVPSAVGKTFRL
ncbi:MAG TPA: MBL fold metallo-hydrolase [Casimicrobiaceae bacterium]|jgi:7,8-dihydropterin-6-yl-methyl-4-(beta-D-ribofuranosyl)aminobenzene 5'-phosphate synthase